MSPAPSRTSRDAIVAAARDLLEADGIDAVVMSRVAERVGVRGPSLYKHVPNRSALIRAVADAVTADLGTVLRGAGTSGDPATDLRAIAAAYRRFVHANPNGYALLFARQDPDRQADPTALAALGLPIVTAVASLIEDDGPAALEGARAVVAWAHGFVSMELAGMFRLGGDLDAAFAAGIDVILAGISARAHPAAR